MTTVDPQDAAPLDPSRLSASTARVDDTAGDAYRSAVHAVEAYVQYQRVAGEPPSVHPSEIGGSGTASKGGYFEHAAHEVSELRRVFRSAAAEVREEQWRAWVGRRYHGWEYRRVTAELGVSKSTTHKWVQCVDRAVREALRSEGKYHSTGGVDGDGGGVREWSADEEGELRPGDPRRAPARGGG